MCGTRLEGALAFLVPLVLAIVAIVTNLHALETRMACWEAADACERIDVEKIPRRLQLLLPPPPETTYNDCQIVDATLRIHRLHALFNARPAEPFSCGTLRSTASTTRGAEYGLDVPAVFSPYDFASDRAAETFLVCFELRRAALQYLGLAATATSVPLEIVPVAFIEDRMMGNVYLADIIVPAGTASVALPPGVPPTTAQPGPTRLSALVVDDGRYQLQINPNDRSLGVPMVVIMALYNRGPQLLEWSTAMSKVQTVDKHEPFRICVADFASTDVDVHKQLERTGHEFRIVRMPGKFSKTAGLNACLETIKDPDAVVFTTDVDVVVPTDFESRVRRFVRHNRQVYAPIVLYDKCTWTTGDCWGDGGYGLVGFTRRDAVKVGMYDSMSFNYREGFEDTDFLLKLYRLPRIVVRRRERDFVHRWHAPSAWANETNNDWTTGSKREPMPRIC